MARRSTSKPKRVSDKARISKIFGGRSAQEWLAAGRTPSALRMHRLFNRPEYRHWHGAAYTPKYGYIGKPVAANRRRLRPNLLIQTRLGGKRIAERAAGPAYQLVELGPESGRMSGLGYPVTVAAHISPDAYVREFTFGGIAKRKAASPRGTRFTTPVKRRHARSGGEISRALRANRSRSMRRIRRNKGTVLLGGANVMQDVVVPVLGGTGGFIAARVVSNGVAQIDAIGNLLDRGAPERTNTKLVADALAIVATLALAPKVKFLARHRGPIVTGMGLSLLDRLIAKLNLGFAMGEYVTQPLQGFGEYVTQPLEGFGDYYSQPTSGFGEYVKQPLGAYVSEAVDQRMSEGMHQATAGDLDAIDPSDQNAIDGLIDQAEKIAGVGAEYATAGVGANDIYYAAAGGLGDDDFTKSLIGPTFRARQFAQIMEPIDAAQQVTHNLPFTREVTQGPVTPEAMPNGGRGHAGGIFARHLFSGMSGS